MAGRPHTRSAHVASLHGPRSARPVDPRAHTTLDVGLGVAMIVLPLAVDWPAAASALSWSCGALILALGAVTQWRGALLYWVPLGVHLVLDAILGLVLLASPWLLDFGDEAFPTVVIMAAGLLEILLAATTDPDRQHALPEVKASPQTIHDGSSVRETLGRDVDTSRTGDPAEATEGEGPASGVSDPDAPAEWPDPMRRDPPEDET